MIGSHGLKFMIACVSKPFSAKSEWSKRPRVMKEKFWLGLTWMRPTTSDTWESRPDWRPVLMRSGTA